MALATPAKSSAAISSRRASRELVVSLATRTLLPSGRRTRRSRRQSEELAELVRYLGDLAEGTTVQGAYESLPECVVAQP